MGQLVSVNRVGAYGFVLMGLEGTSTWLNKAPDDWVDVAVRQRRGSGVQATHIGQNDADVALIGGRSLRLRRTPPAVDYIATSRASPDLLVHPLLAPAAAVHARWQEWTPLHAGAFVSNGRAWLLAGPREGGKSTTLAALSVMGYPIVSDDLIVIRGGMAMAGPRSVDLREKGPFHDAQDLGLVGERRRFRLSLPPVAAETPVGGIISLTWSSSPEAKPARVDDKAKVLRGSLPMPISPQQMLSLLGLPIYEIARPEGDLADTTELIEDTLPA